MVFVSSSFRLDGSAAIQICQLHREKIVSTETDDSPSSIFRLGVNSSSEGTLLRDDEAVHGKGVVDMSQDMRVDKALNPSHMEDFEAVAGGEVISEAW
jgi:hypothetical protein